MERLLTPKEVAELTGFKESTLKKWRIIGNRGPRHQKIEGGAIRYPMSEVKAWIERQAICSSTAQARILNNAS